MMKSIQQRLDREDEGFTLIELMVVLLIIAILLAIAIPTFLGARNTANARSTQENLRNALTAEQSNWTTNQTFNTALTSIEGSLNWSTGSIAKSGGNTVSVSLYNQPVASASTVSDVTPPVTGTNTADSVLLMGFAKDGNCYGIFASDNASASFTSYAYWQQASGGGCSVPADANLPVAAPASGSSASSTAVGANPAWSASF
jgi:type IV pilus assembly protein PilA